MLILTLKTEESFTVEIPGQGKFTIKVCGVTGSRTRIGIAAPFEFKILRSELGSGNE